MGPGVHEASGPKVPNAEALNLHTWTERQSEPEENFIYSPLPCLGA